MSLPGARRPSAQPTFDYAEEGRKLLAAVNLQLDGAPARYTMQTPSSSKSQADSFTLATQRRRRVGTFWEIRTAGESADKLQE